MTVKSGELTDLDAHVERDYPPDDPVLGETEGL